MYEKAWFNASPLTNIAINEEVIWNYILTYEDMKYSG